MKREKAFRSPIGATNEERFSNYYTPEPMSGCYLWTGVTSKWGHGYFNHRNADGTFYTVIAHRYAYIQKYGKIPDGMFACHKCNNASCVNPDHIYIGTPKQNTHDAMRAGTHRSVRSELLKSECNGRAKLNWEKVTQLRKEFAAGGVTKTDLARKYGVSLTAAKMAISGATWSTAR
jgi:hypothetical protein